MIKIQMIKNSKFPSISTQELFRVLVFELLSLFVICVLCFEI